MRLIRGNIRRDNSSVNIYRAAVLKFVTIGAMTANVTFDDFVIDVPGDPSIFSMGFGGVCSNINFDLSKTIETDFDLNLKVGDAWTYNGGDLSITFKEGEFAPLMGTTGKLTGAAYISSAIKLSTFVVRWTFIDSIANVTDVSGLSLNGLPPLSFVFNSGAGRIDCTYLNTVLPTQPYNAVDTGGIVFTHATGVGPTSGTI